MACVEQEVAEAEEVVDVERQRCSVRLLQHRSMLSSQGSTLPLPWCSTMQEFEATVGHEKTPHRLAKTCVQQEEAEAEKVVQV